MNTLAEGHQIRRTLILLGIAVITTCAVGIFYMPLLLPIVVGSVLTYLLLPLVNRLVTMRVRRPLAVAAIVVLFVAMLLFAVARIVPVLFSQVTNLLELAPEARDMIANNVLPYLSTLLSELGLTTDENFATAMSDFDILDEISGSLQAGLAGIWTTGTTVLGGAFNLVMTVIVTFVLLMEQERIGQALRLLVPVNLRNTCDELINGIDQALWTVLKGQAIVACILGLMYIVGFSIVGLRQGVVIGLVAGICRVIPYFDILVGGMLSAIVMFSDFESWWQVVAVILVFIVVQTIDGMLITPRVIGSRIGLHPLVVIMTLLAMAHWFGFWGVLAALPIMAIVKVIWQTVFDHYAKSNFYLR